MELPEKTKKNGKRNNFNEKYLTKKPSQNAWTGDTWIRIFIQNKKFETFYKEVEKHVLNIWIILS